MRSRTVDTIAAGTLAMMDMTALRSSTMKMVASKLDKNLYRCQVRFQWGGEILHVRYQEVDQAVPKDQGDQPGTTSARKRQFPRGEGENDKIESHSVDEGGGKDLVVCVDDRASGVSPHSLQQDA